jgi:hypothetical protein
MILRTRDLNYWGEMNSFRQVFVQSRTREVIDDLDFDERAGGQEEFWLGVISYPERLRAASDYGQPALLTPLPVVREWTMSFVPLPLHCSAVSTTGSPRVITTVCS